MKKFFAILCLAVPLLACLDSSVSPSDEPTFKKLVWSDEFDKNGAPDAARWNYDLGDGCPDVCGWGNNELEYYTNDSKNVRVENGKLIIEAHREEKGGKPYTSTRIVSKQKGDWLYGRLEIMAKLPRGKGTWPAIWMLSTDWKYGGWPASGEIDIMEHVGFNQGYIHGSVHCKKYYHSIGTQRTDTIKVEDCSEKFHVYAVEWNKDSVKVSMDTKAFFKFANEHSGYDAWPFDNKMHLLLNIAVGGNWGGQKGVDENIWPQKMEIDYVRVYQTPNP